MSNVKVRDKSIKQWKHITKFLVTLLIILTILTGLFYTMFYGVTVTVAQDKANKVLEEKILAAHKQKEDWLSQFDVPSSRKYSITSHQAAPFYLQNQSFPNLKLYDKHGKPHFSYGLSRVTVAHSWYELEFKENGIFTIDFIPIPIACQVHPSCTDIDKTMSINLEPISAAKFMRLNGDTMYHEEIVVENGKIISTRLLNGTIVNATQYETTKIIARSDMTSYLTYTVLYVEVYFSDDLNTVYLSLKEIPLYIRRYNSVDSDKDIAELDMLYNDGEILTAKNQ